MVQDRLTRAAYLIKAVQFFESIGTPVERELARGNLPTSAEEMPEAYVSTGLCLAFFKRCLQIEKVDDIGWHIFHSMRPDDLNVDFRRSAKIAVTVHQLLQCLIVSLRLESNFIQCSMKPTNEGVQIAFNDPHLQCNRDTSIVEWIRLMITLATIQAAAGQDWRPKEIGFLSNFRPCDEALDYFGNTRLLYGQKHISITVAHEILAMPVSTSSFDVHVPASAKTGTIPPRSGDADYISILRHVLPPYLADGRVTVALAAEIVGISKRSLQRKLREAGLSFSELADQCLFERATALLADPGVKVIDVALSVGYDDPAHFARSFRRIGGLSPRAYRTVVREGKVNLASRLEPAPQQDMAQPHELHAQ